MTSVIIPACSDGEALSRHLPLLCALPGAKEVIVADGGGNAAGIAAAHTFGARVVRGAAGRGPQLNAGAAAARGERLLFLHADCWLDESALPEVERLLADARIGSGVFRQQIEGRHPAYRLIEGAASLRARLLACPYGDSGLFLRRADFERVGGFPALPICEDLAMAPRLRPLGPIAVARSRVHLSARRWERHGVLRTTLINWWIAASYRAGVSPDRLYRMYYGIPVPAAADAAPPQPARGQP